MGRLKLLGGAVVENDAGGVDALSSRRHPVALLALLATAPSRSLGRGRLVGLLWPDATERTARNRLTSCVWQVRNALGADVLASIGDDLRLSVTALPCDVVDFEAALEARDHRAAVALYDGPLLDGFVLEGSPEFEHRIDRERDRLRRGHRRALEALATEAEARGDAATAAAWWRERVTDDPLDSAAVHRLVAALAAAGNRAEALRAAESHAGRLERELQVEPGPELRRLIDELGPARSTAAAAGPGLPTGASPLAIAVLPFENLGGDAEALPFAMGLHEDLLTELSRIPGLTVISRTSVLRYRNTDQPLQAIARELGVGTIIEGAVQAAGGRVRLNVQLIDARTDAHRWVERYDRALSTDSIFDIQMELARRIAMTLHAELMPARPPGAREPTADLEAYRLYVQGRVLLDQRTQPAFHRAIEYFRHAIRRDTGYGLAWSGLADALSLLEFYDYPAPASAPDPLEAARRAVELAPDAGQAHASLGIIRSIRQDGPGGLRALETAVAMAPSYAEAHAWLGWLHLLRGRPADALEPARRAAELDPLAPAYRAYLAETWLALGDASAALLEARHARQIQPEYGLAHYMEGLALHHLGRSAEAAAALEKALPLVPPRGTPCHAEVHAALAVCHAAAGDRAAADARLSAIREDGHHFSAGLVLAALGDRDEAFTAFERVRDWRSFSTEHFRYLFPDVLGPLRSDPRYQDILHALDRRWGAAAP